MSLTRHPPLLCPILIWSSLMSRSWKSTEKLHPEKSLYRRHSDYRFYICWNWLDVFLETGWQNGFISFWQTTGLLINGGTALEASLFSDGSRICSPICSTLFPSWLFRQTPFYFVDQNWYCAIQSKQESVPISPNWHSKKEFSKNVQPYLGFPEFVCVIHHTE